MRKLVISEKNSAAIRIAYMLSDGTAKRTSVSGVPVMEFDGRDGKYLVLGLRGHIIALDYPEEYNDWSSISVPELVKIDPVKIVDPSARSIVSALHKIANDSDEIIIATDFDREGELIGVETLQEINWDRPIGRAKFSALTKSEILNAFDNLVSVDFALASAAEARQVIDLKWGAALTRFISMATGQTGRDFLSAGRVQSPTLALIVDRERDIENFVPKYYWRIIAELSKESSSAEFSAQHALDIFDVKERATEIFERIKGSATAIVKSYGKQTKEEYPPTPFNTTQFVAEASKLKISVAQAMKIAEGLYTAGYISYPRTDNTVYPKSLNLRNILEILGKTEFGDYARGILSSGVFRATRGKRSTTDHPPIYPTAAADKEKLKGNKWKIYELVCRRFLATVSPSSEVEEQSADIDISGELFIAKGRKLTKRGWRRIYTYWRFVGEPLPDLSPEETLEIRNIHIKEEKTKPASRYSQGYLIQKMEKEGLGTKSTRHEIIQKLYDRKFVHGSIIRPTHIGKALIVALEDHAEMVTNKKMTAHLEDDMDLIAKGELTKEEVIEESQAMLEDIIQTLMRNEKEIASDIRTALEKQKTLGKCPKCKKGDMIIIQMRGGKRFIGCSSYPDCKTAFPVPAMGHIEPTKEVCASCGSPMIKIPERGKKAGNVCINPECEVNKKESSMGICPSCGGTIRIIFSSKGKRFLGCANYPECKTTFPLPQRGGVVSADMECEECGSPVIKIISKGRRPWVLCVNTECKAKNSAKKASNNGEKDAS